MKKFFLVLAVIFCCGYLYANVNVSVTTKLLENAVKDIGGNKVNVNLLVAVSSCPGHSDVIPSQAIKAKKADFVFYHGFEPYVKKLNSKALNVGNGKNLLIPGNYVDACKYICKLFCDKDKENLEYYKKNLDKIIIFAKKTDKEIQSKNKSLKGKKIICSVNNESLLEYFGFNVIAVFPIPDKLTPKIWRDIYKVAKDKKIYFCADNYQSGKDTCLQLSKDIKSKHIWTTNFPGAVKGTETWDKCLKANLNYCIMGKN